MNDQFFPLNVTLIRALSDKVTDKRKTAALQIESIIRDLDSRGDVNQIKKAIIMITNLIQPNNPHYSKGGFIGLTAIGLGLGTETIQPYFLDLVKPFFSGVKYAMPTVRFYATEGLYNVCKVAQGASLAIFNDIFIVMVDLANDTDETVKTAADILNIVMKDVIMLSTSFDIHGFIPVLKEKLYVHETAAQGTVVTWLNTMLRVPGVNLVRYLPSLLDGFFILLSSQNFSVKKATEVIFGEMLLQLELEPQDAIYKEMISTVSVHAQSHDPKVQETALLWSARFIKLSGRKMVPFISSILSSAIPCIALDDEEYANCKTLADELSIMLIDLIKPEDDRPTEEGDMINEYEEDATIDIGSKSKIAKSDEVNLASIVDVLMQQLQITPVTSKTGALRWIYQLNIKLPQRMHWYNKKFFDVLMKTVSDPSDAVVLLGLQVIAQISSMNTSLVNNKVNKEENLDLVEGEFYRMFMSNLMNVFYMDRTLLKERGPYIVRELCVLLPAENIYESMSVLMQREAGYSPDFLQEMVKSFSQILLTAKELYGLRLKMRHLKNKANYELFVILYKTWCHCPVSVLTLCLLAERYDLAEIIINSIAELNVSVALLMELDKLVQLIESPVFTFLRSRLVSQEDYPSLVKTMYGILMLLPQSDTFQLLRNRMSCMPPYPLSRIEKSKNRKYSAKDLELMGHFKSIHKTHEVSDLTEGQEKLMTSMNIS